MGGWLRASWDQQDHLVDQAGFDGNGTHGDTTQVTTSDDDTFTASVASAVKESSHVDPVFVGIFRIRLSRL